MSNFSEIDGSLWFHGRDLFRFSRSISEGVLTFRRRSTGAVRINNRGNIIFQAGSMSVIRFDPWGVSVDHTLVGLNTETCIYEVHFRSVDSSGTTVFEQRVRGRDWPTGEWTPWTPWAQTDVWSLAGVQFYFANVYVDQGYISALTVREGTQGDGDYVPNARIGITGMDAPSPLPMDADDAWAYIQQAASEVMGAAGLDENGEFFFIGKDRLRGVGNPSVEQIGIDGLADLPWSITSDDVADRVEVAYTPVEESVTTNFSQTVWEATEVIQINAGATRTITADFEGVAAAYFGGFSLDLDFTATTGSRWHTYKTATGPDSSPPTGTELLIQTETITPSRVRLRITNRTNQSLWIRTEDGGPYLILRANYTARRGEQQVVEIGASETDAQTPFRHDGGTSIQTFEDASSLAAWLHATLAQPLPVLDRVQVTPNPARRIGQIVTIYDPVFTGIRARAIIAGISQSGQASSYTQTLTLALLGVTLHDKAAFFQKTSPSMTISQRAAWLQSTLGPNTTLIQAANWLEKNSIEVQ